MSQQAGSVAADRAQGLRRTREAPDLAATLGAAGQGIATYGVPFLLVVYLAFQGGGYDPVVRGEVGVAVWWIVGLAAIVGLLPMARIGPAGWIGLGLLVAFGVWTALGISWSESSERSVAEVARVATYAGILALALAIQGWGAARRMAIGVVAAIALVGAFALLSRLHPDWFPGIETGAVGSATRSRLSYPLDYWNGLATLMAMGIPLAVWAAASVRRVAGQAIAAAAVPVMALTALYTISRGGVIELGIGVVVLLALHPRRLAILPTTLLTGAGSAILVGAATQRDALQDNLLNAASASQGDEMLAITLFVCAGVALLQVAIGLARRHGLGPSFEISRPTASVGFAVTAVAVLLIAVAAGLPGWLSDTWDEFKQTSSGGNSIERFGTASGNGRYQLWESAADAEDTDPVTGIGPGTFEYWWAENKTIGGFVRDAHSLYMETFGELGIIGLILIGGFVLFVLGCGVVRAIRAGPERRALLAALTASCAVFAAAAAVDWAWELAVLPVSFLLLAGAIIGPDVAGRMPRGYRRSASSHRTWSRVALALLGLAGIAAIAVPLASAAYVDESRAAFQANRVGEALDKAQSAASVQPYAATPRLQEALILESGGDLAGAAAAARDATRDESTNWRTWLVLSRIEAERGRVAASIDAYREARSLNPRSILFARPAPPTPTP
jgi:O-antigen ligase/polysaccharide polymerase Wzy-like membrane protein